MLFSTIFFKSGSNEFFNYNELMVRKGFYVDFSSLAGSILFLNGFFVSNISSNGPLWSLSFEAWYYILIALFFRAKSFKGLFILALVGLALAFCAKTFLLYGFVWISGVFVGFLHSKNKINTRRVMFCGVIFLVSSLVVGGFYVSSFTSENPLGSKNKYIIPLWNFFIGVAFSCIIGLILDGRMNFPKLFYRTAIFSYTIYIIHFPIFIFFYGVFQNYLSKGTLQSFLISFAAIAFCLAISFVLAKHIESPKIKKIWA